MRRELFFLSHSHILSWRCKTPPNLGRIITLHSHTNPRKLHPYPPLIIIIGRRMLIKLKLLLNRLRKQPPQILKLILPDFLPLANPPHRLPLLLLLLGVLLFNGRHLVLLAIPVQGHLLQKPLDLFVVVFAEVGLVAFDFHVELLDGELFLFGFLAWAFLFACGWEDGLFAGGFAFL